MKYAAIADWADEKQHAVAFKCAQLDVARSGYYGGWTPGHRHGSAPTSS